VWEVTSCWSSRLVQNVLAPEVASVLGAPLGGNADSEGTLLGHPCPFSSALF
jgi:hypothetical protein